MGLYNKRRKKLLHRLEVLGIIPSMEEAYKYGITKEVTAAIAEQARLEAEAKALAEAEAKKKEKEILAAEAEAKEEAPKPKRRKRSKSEEE